MRICNLECVISDWGTPWSATPDEWKILELLQADAAIDVFGVGTALGAGMGSAERGFAGGALGAAYKDVWYVELHHLLFIDELIAYHSWYAHRGADL